MPRDSLDIELQPLSRSQSSQDGDLAPSTPRSSSGSAASQLLQEVNYLGRNSPNYEDFESDTQFISLMPVKRLKRAALGGLVVIIAVVYTAWLLSYRSGNHSSRNAIKNSTLAQYTSSTASIIISSGTPILSSIATTQAPMKEPLSSILSQDRESSTPTTTKELVALTEKPTRPSREPIPHLGYKESVLQSQVMFVSANNLKKKDDDGLYLIKQGNRFVLKKLADPEFEKTLHDSDKFDFEGQEIIIEALIPHGNGSKALIFSNYEKRFRHSTLADFYLFDANKGDFTAITSGKSTSKIQHASWSSTGKYVSFVQDGDLYVFDTETRKVDAVTTDGSEEILNGKTDWVYEEEILATDSAIWWSADDKQLAFLKFNETGVEELPLEKFDQGVYPKLEYIKYPKPGNTNPRVSLHHYEVEGKSLSAIERGDSKLGDDWICYGSTFIDNTLVIRETDRESKKLDYRVVKDHVSRVFYSIDSSKYDGWIENFNDMIAIPRNETVKRSTDGFVDIVENNGYNHIGLFESLDSTEGPIILTSGEWEVISILKFDDTSNLLYFTANRQSHFEKHLFAVDITTKQIYSISDISTPAYHEVVFSPGARFAYDYNEGPTFPLIYLIDTNSFTIAEKPSSREKRSVDFTGARRSYHTVALSDGETVDVIEMVPENFNKTKKHPLLLSVYGGPGFRKLNVMLHTGFEDNISDDLDAVILYIDPRGTGGQGWKYRSYAKRHIGHWEPRDLTEMTKLWLDSRDYIDEEKVAIWGWSYGGFTTLKTLEYDQGNVFKYGMAVAPVTDWRMYDSMYTERYMDQPKDNEDGYKESRIAHVEGLKGVKRFSIMHGTGDDNVHIQNTYKLLDDLNMHSITNFDLMVYPDSDHNINYHNAYSNLMTRLREWAKNNILEDHQ